MNLYVIDLFLEFMHVSGLCTSPLFEYVYAIGKKYTNENICVKVEGPQYLENLT